MAFKQDTREDFLDCILTTAVESSYPWFAFDQYQYVYDGEVVVYCGEQVGDGSHAIVRGWDPESDEEEHTGEPVNVTPRKIAGAIHKVLDGRVPLHSAHVATFKQANAENDAGMIDADLADCLLQIIAFGEVVYG